MVTTHEMVVVERIEPGLEVWACPRCGRRIRLRWPPNYDKQVLVPGDEDAPHAGSSGGVRVSSVEVAPDAPRLSQVSPHESRWLRDSGIDWEASA